MRKYLTAAAAALFCVCCSSAVRAQAPAPAKPDAAPALRDPFWPVGFVPHAAEAADGSAAALPESSGSESSAGLRINNLSDEQQAEFRKRMQVSGFMRVGKDYLARINDQLVAGGDEVSVMLDGQQFVFLVKNITKDSVQLEPKR